MATLSSLSDALEFLAERNRFHAKILLGLAAIFALSGAMLIGFAFSMQGTERLVMVVGGALFLLMILFPYNQMQNLQNQNGVMDMVGALIERFQGTAATEKLDAVFADMADAGPIPLDEILAFVHRLDSRQRRNLMATSFGLLAAIVIAGVTLKAAYPQVKKTTAAAAVGTHERVRDERTLEPVAGNPVQGDADIRPVARQLEPPVKPGMQTGAASEAVATAAPPPKPEPSPDTKKLVALQEQISALEHERSAARQALEQERQRVALLQEKVVEYRKDTAEVQNRIEGLEKEVEKQDYLRLINEALAYTYRKAPGDEERAETAYRNAVRIAQAQNIRDPLVYNAYAALLQEHKRFDEAEKFYKIALEINPSYGPALYNLGTLYEGTGKREKALEHYKAAEEAGEKLGAERYSRLRSINSK